jgi:hypothetical protein
VVFPAHRGLPPPRPCRVVLELQHDRIWQDKCIEIIRMGTQRNVRTQKWNMLWIWIRTATRC